MHKLQKILLKRLKFQNNQRYGTLTSGYDFEDNIVFHLNKLLSSKYISKTEGIYSITLDGIKEIAKYEPFELEDKGIKTFFIGFLCSNEENNYLLKSHPNAKSNFYNLPSGKPFFGENIEDSLVKNFELNTGLTLPSESFKFASLHLKTIVTNDNEVIFDDAFSIYNVKVNKQQKEKMKLMNSIEWKSIDEIVKLENRWPELDICILQKDFEIYKAYRHISNYIL